MFNKYSMLEGRASQGLRDIFDWEPDRLDLISLNPAEDESGIGAALVASLAVDPGELEECGTEEYL